LRLPKCSTGCADTDSALFGRFAELRQESRFYKSRIVLYILAFDH
jgi:hypothetical protein